MTPAGRPLTTTREAAAFGSTAASGRGWPSPERILRPSRSSGPDRTGKSYPYGSSGIPFRVEPLGRRFPASGRPAPPGRPRRLSSKEVGLLRRRDVPADDERVLPRDVPLRDCEPDRVYRDGH